MPQPAHPAAVNGLTLAQAEIIADAALRKGRELGLLPLCVVVLDAGGHLKSAKREDGASLLRPEIATGKAFGALSMGFGTRELARRAQSMPGFTNALSDLTGGKAVPAQGGVLVRDANNVLLGAVGISGDVSAKDEECCIAGIEAGGLMADTGDPA
ncbi:GlcG/HbpS family heme-binding protein [Sabulicella glaciei]|uniref:Heme-binding protein n=1 Tax=Sabulicella glaciei TaxID=2984948 RepID=A0ABT3NY52_9PROT|nr:heme-binding protein [Roseococcus sp. MDT2-1-1]MCW8087058.1 heme-binding protein [Roseococcus sp. MDT2-1-1]